MSSLLGNSNAFVSAPAINAMNIKNNMMMFNKGSKNDQPFPAMGESLFSMALYDMGSSSLSAPAAPRIQPQFYPSEEYKDLSLLEILDMSEDCLFSEDEDEECTAPMVLPSKPTSAPSVVSPVTVHPPAPAMSKEDLEWSQLDEVPIMDQSVDDIPVAAALVSSMDACLDACLPSSRKRSCDLMLEEFETEHRDEHEARFRPYQTGQWSEKFQELCEYRQKNGHCLVPHTYMENLPLARWVKRQRYQYKLLIEGKTSTMTEDRVKALEDIGFVWDSQGAAWGERLAELKQYKASFHHCNVPSNFNENPQLATWVKCQRRQFKLFMEGKPSNMTSQRIEELNELGFEWELRSYKRQKN